MRCYTGCHASLVAGLQSNVSLRQQQAVKDIQTLAAESSAHRKSIIAAGALSLLVPLLGSVQPALQEAAADPLWTLTANSRRSKDAIIAAGAVLALLTPHQPAVQAAAAGTLCKSRIWLSAEYLCHNCSRRCASAHCLVEGNSARCAVSSSKNFENFRQQLSTE